MKTTNINDNMRSKVRYAKACNNISTLKTLLFLSFFLTPIFGFLNEYGFYSVEWGFFALSPVFLLISIYSWIKGNKLDNRLYIFFSCFMVFLFLSLLDTYDTRKGILYSLQFVCYISLFFTIIALIREEYQLNDIIKFLSYIAAIVSILIIVLSLYYGSRTDVNNFLLNYFSLAVNKVFSFIIIPFVYIIIKFYFGKATVFDKIIFYIFLVALFSTGSRGSYLAVLISLFAGFVFAKRYTRGIFLVSLLSILLVTLFNLDTFSFIRERIQKLAPTNRYDIEETIESYSRLYTGKVALELLLDHPLNGVGVGNISNYSYEAAYDADVPYELIKYWERRKYYETTNSYLKLGAETGIAGFLFIPIWYFFLWKRARRLNDEFYSAFSRTYIFVSLFHNLLDLEFYNYYTWIGYAIIYILPDLINKPGNPPAFSGGLLLSRETHFTNKNVGKLIK